MERSVALRRRIFEQCKAAGVKRLITVCAGCGEELAAVFDESIEIVPLPQLLVEGGARVALAAGEGAGAAGAADAVGAAGEYASGIAGEVAASCGDSGILGVFDSCHDRNCAHGCQIRELLAGRPQAEVTYHGKFTLCCGAGGAAPSYNPGLSEARVARALRAAQVSGVDTLVTSCPTCSYTFNQHLLGAAPVAGERAVQCRHYLELLFDEAIDWAAVFARLQDMWSGEYAAWVYEQLV
jgi:Fe-S oxidoreductase